MQRIWSKQENEHLYAISEATLQKQLSARRSGLTRSLDVLELSLVAVNIFVALFLLFDTVTGNGPLVQLLVSTVSMAVVALIGWHRYQREASTVEYDQSILGEVDKTIEQANILIQRTQTVFAWYFLPMIGANIALFLVKGLSLWWSMAFVVLGLTTFFALRWEIAQCQLPRKRELESLRAILLDS